MSEKAPISDAPLAAAPTTERPRLVFEYDLDSAPDTVWCAIRSAEFREKWLPAATLASRAPVSETPGREVRYRMRDGSPPFLESLVTIAISPNAAGGTRLTIVHQLADARLARPRSAVNSNGPMLTLAA